VPRSEILVGLMGVVKCNVSMAQITDSYGCNERRNERLLPTLSREGGHRRSELAAFYIVAISLFTIACKGCGDGVLPFRPAIV
jgi:hypothetical protein